MTMKLPTISTDKPVVMESAPTAQAGFTAQLHYDYGADHVDVDIQANGKTKRVAVTLTAGQQAAAKNLILAAFQALGVAPTEVPPAP